MGGAPRRPPGMAWTVLCSYKAMMKSADPSLRVLLLFLLAAGLTACGGGGGGVAGTPVGDPLQVLSVVPADGSQGVDVEASVRVTFSDVLDPASILTDTIRVGVVGSGAISGTTSISQDGGGRVLEWVPTAPMAAVSTHAIIVDSSVRSVSGQRLERDLTFTFRTAGGVAPPPLPDPDQLRPTLGKLNIGRRSHTATLLTGGSVLIAGGFTQDTNITDRAELYSSEVFSLIPGTMRQERASHTATLLTDGRVLLAGGWYEASVGSLATTARAEVYNPSSGTFTEVGSMTVERVDHAAALLPDGRVLVTGGSRLDAGFLLDLDTAEIFDPQTNTFTLVQDPMIHTHSTHAMEMTGSGRVVLVGGSDTNLAPEYFDPATETFHVLTIPSQDGVRFGTASATFASGAMCAAGGDPLGTVLYVDSETSFVNNTGSGLDRPRAYAAAARIADDRILVTGGFDTSQGFFMLHSIDIVIEGGIGGSRTYGTELRFAEGLALHTATRLADGKVLFCGGLAEQSGQPERDVAYLFTP